MFGFVVLICGILLLFTGCFSIFGRMKCTQAVQAFYIGEQAYKSGTNVTQYTVRFQYSYRGQTFTGNSIETFSASKLYKKFQPGKQYMVYINPTKPKRVCIGKGIYPSDIIFLFFGTVFLIGGILL